MATNSAHRQKTNSERKIHRLQKPRLLALNCAIRRFVRGESFMGKTLWHEEEEGHDEAGVNINVDQYVSTACNQAPCPNPNPGTDYAERRVSLVVSK